MANSKEAKLRLFAYAAAFGNALLTSLVLLSPFGAGEGNGVIGYSILRLLVMVVIHAPIAVGGIVAAILSFRDGFKGLWGLALNIAVLACAFFLYFAQAQTLERLR